MLLGDALKMIIIGEIADENSYVLSALVRVIYVLVMINLDFRMKRKRKESFVVSHGFGSGPG